MQCTGTNCITTSNFGPGPLTQALHRAWALVALRFSGLRTKAEKMGLLDAVKWK
ncbi:hypothetical protein F441_04655 [Phytophthora nicotianae CJ01A1]|uniref:Uncharacterized protein n=6 Tax=Phytophthora nicotianae TaxID=4792 RepID=W2QII6_PHYN3|nr:hypothetical protein PPTG_22436 [Phytophthora nicotianae INRA-310]ETI52152.1 hypothetical protein F443_04668 [Phytophthora nicotianae P1569]ETK92040.1 hypothetical protein L915_04553 [Phytophthora nicotianae]ETO80926.1 hypothetical protein F444_04699 [Phytophthora nicotianae P1976]ETP21954.1 hypothetical protein F441_04655 [Phytophthora nicotianae CJ01A1]ETP49857.1 hypothetical protein F442_04717 [Phytophthora nicotianae P10297]